MQEGKRKDKEKHERILQEGETRMKKEKVPIPQKLLLTVEEAAEYSNIGMHKIRELLEEKDCDFALRKGCYTLIKRTKFEKYLLDKEVI